MGRMYSHAGVFEAVEYAVRAQGHYHIDPESKFGRWYSWAKKYIESMDPTRDLWKWFVSNKPEVSGEE